ncbi:MAG: Tol-Pal system beta propeller repeat protein TolB [Proteobacteria bacterium]|nr:Tol-Pal system beta propeller repeat protein TolB [Pseudomonadota bacterium]MBU1233724.1 Tol-Pal system beta propeller repeat protein TolB [Pseudomonadota bacterium]MBU1420485.1 Tol-Pal system beta propeller repeat protein TolB [Pseudomonadota bacterium]MBU1456048.1 Tol-Pal system beta propeller repeat protein TolB [Pseudomonadota bacterium]
MQSLKIRFSFSLFLLFVLLPLSLQAAQEIVYLDITSAEARKINIAVPWFINKEQPAQLQPFGRELAKTLSDTLIFHGIFTLIDEEKYGKRQDADWKSLGADFVMLGSYSLSGKGMQLELRLQDVAGGDMLMGKRYNGTREQQLDMLFKFCDAVIMELTGQPGIATSKIAFVSDRSGHKEVYLTDILGREERQVTRHKNLTVSPRFIPGGRYLTYSSYHAGNQNLYITDLQQSKTTRPLSRRKGMNLAPAWSSDGNKMVLTLSNDGNPDLFLMDRKGKILKQLTRRSGINVSPTWSPDEKRLAFVSDRSGRPQVYIMEVDSGKAQRLTFKGTENAEPCWSPKGDLIVYSSLVEGLYQIFTISPNPGATPTQVTNGPGQHESPSWSPDGKQILFSLRNGQDQKVYAILRNGSYQRQLFNFPGNQTYPRWTDIK